MEQVLAVIAFPLARILQNEFLQQLTHISARQQWQITAALQPAPLQTHVRQHKQESVPPSSLPSVPVSTKRDNCASVQTQSLRVPLYQQKCSA
eukprot:6477075-Amphidinium_carterae.1